jgi:hypothetical protein
MSPVKDLAPSTEDMEPKFSVQPRPRLLQLPIPAYIGSYLNCSSISINTKVPSDVGYTLDLLNITLTIYFKTVHLFKHRSGIVGTLRRSFCLQVLKNKHFGELLIDMSPTGICLNNLVLKKLCFFIAWAGITYNSGEIRPFLEDMV